MLLKGLFFLVDAFGFFCFYKLDFFWIPIFGFYIYLNFILVNL
jgi:hypothetical protein